MKKRTKAFISIILSVVMLLGCGSVASAADVAASPVSAVGDAAGNVIASALNTAFNTVVEALLGVIVKFIPDSVKVGKVSEYKTENFYSGNGTFRDEPAEGAKWQLGYSSASIVPDDFSTGKYYKGGYALNVNLTEVLDDLRVRVIAISDGSGRGTQIFAVIDCIGLANADVRLIRKALEPFAKENNITSINVSATHVHSGIDTQGIYTDIINSALKNIGASIIKSDKLAPAIDTDFLDLIVNKTAQCAKEAYNNMTPGKLTYAKKDIEPYVRDRTAPDISLDDLYRLMFTPDNGSKGTIIANFGAHPEAIGFAYDVATSDFVYYIEQVVNGAGYNFMYIQGAVGTITENMGISSDGICENRIESVQRYGQEIGYILLGMTKTEQECIDTIVDEAREALAYDSEEYTPWYEDWQPVTERELAPVLNIKLAEYLVPVDNGVYQALGKVSLANNQMLKENGKYYCVTEVGYMELGDVKVILSPGETYAELIKGGSNMENFEYDCAYDIMGTEDVLVFDLMNDAAGYVMPDDYFTYATIRNEGGLTIDSSWGLTSLGRHAASNLYGQIYRVYNSVR